MHQSNNSSKVRTDNLEWTSLQNTMQELRVGRGVHVCSHVSVCTCVGWKRIHKCTQHYGRALRRQSDLAETTLYASVCIDLRRAPTNFFRRIFRVKSIFRTLKWRSALRFVLAWIWRSWMSLSCFFWFINNKNNSCRIGCNKVCWRSCHCLERVWLWDRSWLILLSAAREFLWQFLFFMRITQSHDATAKDKTRLSPNT